MLTKKEYLTSKIFQPIVKKSGDWTLLRSLFYNYDFNRRIGTLVRWGRTKDEDPVMSPVGPEIADIEIVTGNCSGGCPWCYKSNPKTPDRVMTALTFDRILRKMPQSLTQVALGITDLDANPDLIEIMDICRFWEIVPNLTTSAMGNLALLDDVAKRAGAIAVSIYPHNIEQAYDVICYLTEFYPELQVNAHLLYHNGNPYFVETIINDCSEDPRLSSLNALVLLGLKPKGRGSNMKPLGSEEFADLIDQAMEKGVSIGMDSCSTPKFLSWMENHPDKSRGMEMFVEPCESSLFSIYINVDGTVFPCSFTEGCEGYEGVDMLDAESFMRDVWYSEELTEFRGKLMENGRECPEYPEING